MPTSAAAFHNFSFELQLTFDNNNFPYISIAEINLENILRCCTSFSYSSPAELPLSWRVVWNTIDWNWIQLMRNVVATSWMAKYNIESYWARFFLCWTQISNPIKVIFFSITNHGDFKVFNSNQDECFIRKYLLIEKAQSRFESPFRSTWPLGFFDED